ARHVELECLVSNAPTITRDVPVVFYCALGARSELAAAAFRRAGYDAYSLVGGIVAWRRRELPVHGGWAGRKRGSWAARVAASARGCTPSLRRMFDTWTPAVLALMNRAAPISRFVRPSLTSLSTASSRAVRRSSKACRPPAAEAYSRRAAALASA